MGKHIDRALMGMAAAVALYLYFLNAWNSIPLACLSAFVCCLCLGWLVNRRPFPKHASRQQARAELLRIAELPDEEAQAVLAALIRARHPLEVFTVSPVLKHPEASMSAGDLLNAWKANRDAENLVIAATCPCEPRAALFARDLNSPPVAVLDSRDLLRMLRRCPSDSLPALPRKSAAERLRRLAARLSSTRFSPKYIPIAAVLLTTYLVTGNPCSFFCSMAILGHLGVTLIQRRTGRRLFQEAGSQ